LNRLDDSSISTKDRIFYTALNLFYESGYSHVSLRDIAECVGIKAPSIYNHFSTKEDILRSMYTYYDKYWTESGPDLDELLVLAETEAPLDVIEKLNFSYPPNIEPIMLKIVRIAVAEMHTNYRSEQFINKYLFDTHAGLLQPLLDQMVKLKRIQPMDTHALSKIWNAFSFNAVVMDGTAVGFSPDDWSRGWSMLTSLIKPI
jgi:AcrR family transcriptional regulator